MSISLLQGKNINWLIKMGKSQTLLTFEIPTQERTPPRSVISILGLTAPW